MSGESQRPQPPSGVAGHGNPKYLTGRLGRKLFDDYHYRKEERELYEHFRGIVWNRIQQRNGRGLFGVSSLLLSDGIGYTEGLVAGAVTVGMMRWRRRHRGSLRLFGGDGVRSTTAPTEATTFGFGRSGRGRFSALSPANSRQVYHLDHVDQPSRPLLLLLREGIVGSVAAALVGASCTDTRRVREGLVGLPLSLELSPPRRRATSAGNDDPGTFTSESSTTTTSSSSTITDGLCDDILVEIRLLSASSSAASELDNEDKFRRRTGAYRRLVNNEQSEVTEETLALRDVVAFAENCRKRQRRQ